jgi:GT2 family glycosyltransferase
VSVGTSDRASRRPTTLCVVNWNGERYLEHTLGAARQSGRRFDEILLVDNASDDRSVEIVRACFPEVTVLALDRNGGPGAARNAGFAAAQHDAILFADNDVALTRDCADRLHDALADRSDALVAMPRVLYADRPDVIQYDGADCHFLGLMVTRNADRPLAGAPREVADTTSVVTACFLIDRARWRGGEPFDAGYIFNYEDHDFGVRSRVMGHALLSVPAATCLHAGGTPGLSFREGRARSAVRVYCLIRNRWRIVLQCYALRTLLVLAPALALYELFQLAGAARKGWLGTWLRAAAWMLTHPGVVLRRRREVQRRRGAPDRDVLRAGPLPFTPGLASGKLERMVRRALDRGFDAYWRLGEHAL